MLRYLVLAFLAFMAVGCVRSFQPVLRPEQVTKMPQLAGNWVSEKDGSMQIIAVDDKLEVIYTKDDKSADFEAKIGKAGKLTIVDVYPGKLPEGTSEAYGVLLAPLHGFFVVSQTDPELHGRMMKPDWFKEYIAHHPEELPVVMVENNPVINAPPEITQQFIEKHLDDKDAWSDELVFKRAVEKKK